jgi:hypothetical protein
MGWLGRIFNWVWKGVVEVVKTVFKWAFENPVVGLVVGGATLLYGIIARNQAYSFVGAAILVAAAAGWLTGGSTKVFMPGGLAQHASATSMVPWRDAAVEGAKVVLPILRFVL